MNAHLSSLSSSLQTAQTAVSQTSPCLASETHVHPVASTERPTGTLTSVELTLRDDLLGTEPTDAEVARAERVAPTTTGTLIAMAAFLASVDDDHGAALLRRFATEYATYEATVI
jgi:hypothetical protein